MRQITESDIYDLALGSAVLGTGGGGDPYLGALITRQAMRERGFLPLWSVGEVPDNAVVIASAGMGAPTVMVEKLPRGDEMVVAFRALETYLGRRATAAISIEIGGGNSVLPVVTSLRCGIPLVDGDMMGRAFPELQMCTPGLYGISATPMALADERGNSAIIETIDNLWTETLARTTTIQMGATSWIAVYHMTGAQVKQAVIPGTISFAIEIGAAIRSAKERGESPVAAVQRLTRGHQLFQGKVVDVARRTERGFARGTASLEGFGEHSGRRLTLEFQNENLVAEADGEIIATVPDLICTLDVETGHPITTEHLRYGLRVVILGIPCAPQWRSEGGLALTGPRYFGYDVDYIPIESRFSAS